MYSANVVWSKAPDVAHGAALAQQLFMLLVLGSHAARDHSWCRNLPQALCLSGLCACQQLEGSIQVRSGLTVRLQVGDTESFGKFEAMLKGAPFRKGLELGFTSTPEGGLAARVDNKDVRPAWLLAAVWATSAAGPPTWGPLPVEDCSRPLVPRPQPLDEAQPVTTLRHGRHHVRCMTGISDSQVITLAVCNVNCELRLCTLDHVGCRWARSTLQSSRGRSSACTWGSNPSQRAARRASRMAWPP